MPVKSVPAMCKHVVCFLAYLTETSCMPCSATCYLPANDCLSDLSKPCLACCLSGRVLQKLRASHYGLSYENFVQAMLAMCYLTGKSALTTRAQSFTYNSFTLTHNSFTLIHHSFLTHNSFTYDCSQLSVLHHLLCLSSLPRPASGVISPFIASISRPRPAPPRPPSSSASRAQLFHTHLFHTALTHNSFTRKSFTHKSFTHSPHALLFHAQLFHTYKL